MGKEKEFPRPWQICPMLNGLWLRNFLSTFMASLSPLSMHNHYSIFLFTIFLIHLLMDRLLSKRGTENFWKAMPSGLHNRNSPWCLLMVFFGFFLGPHFMSFYKPVPPAREKRAMVVLTHPQIVPFGLHKTYFQYCIGWKKRRYFLKTKSEFLLLEMCINMATKVLQFLTVCDFNSRYLLIKDVSPSL